MIHLTITTGHSRYSPRDEVARESQAIVVDGLIERLRARNHVPRWDLPRSLGWLSATSEGAGLIVTAWREVQGQRAPLVTWGVAPDAPAVAALWPALVRQQQTADGLLREIGLPPQCREIPPSPESTPWIAVVLELGLALAPDAAGWLGDLERVVAWAWVDEIRRRGEK